MNTAPALPLFAGRRFRVSYDGLAADNVYSADGRHVQYAIVSGAYAAEVIRGAVQAVPKGQLEAARALGMHRLLILRRILVPQALRYALPGLGNVWQMTLKDTTLVSVITLAELMRQAYIAMQSTRQPFLFYLTAALIYLVLTSVSDMGFRWAGRRAERGVRRTATA